MGQNIVLVDTDALQQMIRATIFDAVSECMPKIVDDGRDWYTRQEVADKWGVSKQTIWRYSKLGYIKCCRVGKVVRYNKEYIDGLDSLIDDSNTTYWTKVDKILKKQKKASRK